MKHLLPPYILQSTRGSAVEQRSYKPLVAGSIPVGCIMRRTNETYEQMSERLREEQRARREKYRIRISAYKKEYRARSEVKERERLRKIDYNKRPDVKEHRKEYDKTYRTRSDVVERRRIWHREYQRSHQKEYRKQCEMRWSNISEEEKSAIKHALEEHDV